MNFITEMIDLFYAIKHLYKKIGGARDEDFCSLGERRENIEV